MPRSKTEIVGEIKGKTLVLHVPVKALRVSKSGASLIFAESEGYNGFQKIDMNYKGKPVTLQLRAMIKNDEEGGEK